MDGSRRDITEKQVLRVGLDIDDTITRCPAFFALLSNVLLQAGHQVYILSYRDGREETEEELREYGIRYTALILADDVSFAKEGFFEWKANKCKELGIDILFEDMPEVLNELDASTIAFCAFDHELGQLTYVDRKPGPAITS